MAVLVEAISVIVRRDSIDREYRGGWEAFLDAVPNATLCYDEELARVGFMTPDDAEQFLEVLMAHGLTFLEHDRSKDIAIVVQEQGPVTPCEWLGFGQLPLGTGEVSACWLSEGPRGAASDRREEVSIRLATPPDWNLEGSLSQRFTSVPAAEIGDHLRFLRTEGDVEVYLDVTTGREVYIGRTS